MPRICYHADESYWDNDLRRYLLIAVTEGEPGYRVVEGRDNPDLAALQAEARHRNACLSLSEEDVLNIRASSMFPPEARRDQGDFYGAFPLYGTNLVVVTFAWNSRHGKCNECGLPAQFFLPRAYINEERTPGAPDQPPTDTNKRCAICAANAATDGEPVRRIGVSQ